jgi:anti-sigma factor RsiW
MDCPDFVELIAQKLDGTLPGDKASLLESHLSGCPRCRAEIILQKKIGQALEQQAHSGLSENFTEILKEKVRAEARAERRLIRWPYLVPAFSLIILTVVLFVLRAELLQVFSFMIEPLAEAISETAARISDAMADSLARTGNSLSERASSLEELFPPVAVSLIVAFLVIVSTATGLQKVFAFLRE